MCLIAFAFQHHPDYPLLLVANRDEFYARPTRSLHWWDDDPAILGGRDMQEGGTWMGMHQSGRFAALTNFRDPEHMRNDRPSRGQILRRYLNGDLHGDEMVRYLRTQGRLFNGFNLIFGTNEELFYYSNVKDQFRQLYPGIYGLSNAYLDTPWPKVERAKEGLQTLLSKPNAETPFIDLMHNTETAEEALLPNTGVPPEWEKKLSAMFITSEDYGTRLTTFVSVDRTGNVVYRERSYIPEGDTRITFQLQA